MAASARKISTTVFLLAIFVFLVIFVGAWIYRVYITQTSYSKDESSSAVNCVGYSFEVDKNKLNYKNGLFSFEFKQTGGNAINTLIVESSKQKKELNITNNVIGEKTSLNLNILLSKQVRIYPKGCRIHNFKLFNVN